MKRLITLVFLSFTIISSAQITNLGLPKSFSGKLQPLSSVPVTVMPGFDLQLRLFEDSLNHANKVGMYMFGNEYDVAIDILQTGLWETLPNGSKVCRYRIHTPDSYTINIQFHNFFLPEGSRLDVYTPDHTFHHGSYTSMNNNSARLLGTDIVPGEEMVIEYFEPAGNSQQASLVIGMVVHGYRNIFTFSDTDGDRVNESGNCNMDVICPDGTPWAIHKQAVARILNGGGLCTGTLLNNTANDGTPYFLTANHCSPQTMGAATFRFNYESTICGTGGNSVDPGSPYDQVNGSVLRARRSDSDFGLIELNSVPPAAYQVYYAGWDHSGVNAPTVVGIHHPAGDVKKLAFDDDPITNTSYSGNSVPGDGTHWRIETWERLTTTEGGSSGSAIFDNNGRVIGQLHGGAAACGNTSSDWYGCFHVSWDGSSSSARLRDWLDPSNTTVTLDGFDPNSPSSPDDAGITSVTDPAGTLCSGSFTPAVTLRNYGSNSLTSVQILYNIDGGTNQVYNWSGTLATSSSTTVTLPTQTSAGGAHTFNATTNLPNGNPDGNNANDNASSSFTLVVGGEIISFELQTDCWGDEVDWEVQDGGGATLFSGGPYGPSSATGDYITDSWCLTPGCYNFIINDSYGDGMHGDGVSGCTIDGYYNIEDSQGNVLATIQAANSDYGNQEINNFCVVASSLTANFTQNDTEICAGASVTFSDASTGGATSWSWVFNGGTPATSNAQNPVVTYNTPGTYDVELTVTDASSGTDTYTLSGAVIVHANPSISVTGTNVTCNGDCNGTGTAGVTGGTAPYNIIWTGGLSGTNITSLCAGTYTASVTDDNGCTAASNTLTVTEPLALNATAAVTNATCGVNDGIISVTATGGTSPFQYALNSGTPQSASTFNGLATGSYSIDVFDASGCVYQTIATIGNPNAPSAVVAGADISCFGTCDGSAVVSATGGTGSYTYSWSPSGGSSSSASMLCQGTYNITVTDAANCVTNVNVTINEPAALTVSGIGTDELTGNDGTINLSVSGGTSAYSYAWTGPSGFTSVQEDLTGLTSGTYTVVVTDANGCTATTTITVGSQVGLSEITPNHDITVYPNPNNGSFFVYSMNTFGDNAGLNLYSAEGRLVGMYSLKGVQTLHVQEKLAAGVYIIEVTGQDTRFIKRIVIE